MCINGFETPHNYGEEIEYQRKTSLASGTLKLIKAFPEYTTLIKHLNSDYRINSISYAGSGGFNPLMRRFELTAKPGYFLYEITYNSYRTGLSYTKYLKEIE